MHAALLAEVGKLRLQESNSKEAELAKSAFKLDSIRDEHHRLVEDTEKLQNENKTLKERNQQVMRQCTQTLGEKNKLAARVRELEEALASAGAGAASAAEASVRGSLRPSREWHASGGSRCTRRGCTERPGACPCQVGGGAHEQRRPGGFGVGAQRPAARSA